ncbi:hypothetical protein [Streptomyces sp. NPDC060035]|uniref:hypothetical protein n=1 Tax=Streptomyces sp. NPDC060035 TaxID=3347044 RepID=UPI003698747C
MRLPPAADTVPPLRAQGVGVEIACEVGHQDGVAPEEAGRDNGGSRGVLPSEPATGLHLGIFEAAP